MVQRRVNRLSCERTSAGTTTFRTTAARDLMELKEQMIESGELQIGEEFHPVPTTKVTSIDGQGQLRPTEKPNPARVLPLQEIRLKHLQLMKNLGLLRSTDASSLTDDELKQQLTKLHSELHKQISDDPYLGH